MSAPSAPAMIRSMSPPRRPILLLHLHADDPRLEAHQQIGEQLARGLIGEFALRVELARRVADEDLGAGQHVTPEPAEEAGADILDAGAVPRAPRGWGDGG